MNNNIIDFQNRFQRKKLPETENEISIKKENLNYLIDNSGLRGFFINQKTPEPNGIVLDYDVEEIKNQQF